MCRRFPRSFPGVAVLVVHHTGKDAKKGERGHTALRAAADTILRLSKKNSALTLKCEKQKDAEALKDLGLKLREVGPTKARLLASSTEGPAEPTTSAANSQVLKLKSDATALDALIAFGQTGAKFSAWEEASGLKPSTFKDALKRLVENGLVDKDDDGNWFATESRPKANSSPVSSLDTQPH